MARRPGFPLYWAKFCGNISEKEVHDLDNEKTCCQINETIAARHALPFNDLATAHKAGHDNCAYCIGGSTR